MKSFQDDLVEIIAQESGLDAGALLSGKGLMSGGLLDSFALVAVITFVEDRIGGEVPPSDLSFENFDSIARICAYVERALGD